MKHAFYGVLQCSAAWKIFFIANIALIPAPPQPWESCYDSLVRSNKVTNVGILQPSANSPFGSPPTLYLLRIWVNFSHINRIEQARKCLILLLKGLPWETTTEMLRKWIRPLEIVSNGVILLYDEYGDFTGDAYLRFPTNSECVKAKNYLPTLYLLDRFIQAFHATPAEYEEFYRTGFRKHPKERNFVTSLLTKTQAKINCAKRRRSQKYDRAAL
ncbi:putative Epithelial splicing regulatory protein 2 [Cardiosporidium cionae]|uniref:Epithelial splicing regulatory protein 2 n=1 Tax=Cardiosporidium cionae TaxID=476202 RepID=A0ABQ7JB21_9APIC|nr:putative Epithelial splicing regulatory protein 2 [Cardiosporidium cionae]|eukprot:KAF8821202.1 putative Epithelial splicing regulatory protein 2 [Cardiosporidium cionae]